jgi:hypothetical protein
MFKSVPDIPGLCVYVIPMQGHRYVVGGDPAGGNPTSDDSAAEVVDVATGEECACFAGKFEPATFAGHLDALAQWYNAQLMVERNNHGHAVLLWLKDNGKSKVMVGHDGQLGWNTSTKSKAIMYGDAGEAFRDCEVILHSLETFTQLCSIEGSTLRAPENMHDDRAIAFALCLTARAGLLKRWVDIHKVLDELEKGGKPEQVVTTDRPLTVMDKGGVVWQAPHECYYLYLVVERKKRYVWNSPDRQEAEYGAVVAGFREDGEDLATVTEDRREAIRRELNGKLTPPPKGFWD